VGRNTRRRLAAAASALALGTALAAQGGWQANPEVAARTAAQQKGQFNYEESRVGTVTLPELFASPDAGESGKAVSREQWIRRRAEVLELFREHVYGRRPGPPDTLQFDLLEENRGALDGAATLQRVAVNSVHQGRRHRFELTLFLPNGRRGPAALFLLLNNRPATNTDPTRKEKSGFWPAEQVIARGYGIAALQVGELAPDDAKRFREGVITLFEGSGAGARQADAWGALAAWGWGASRAMDYFQSNPRIDASRVAVVGHSRGGKAALWAGAEDDRFALVVSNDSGEGGAALTRRDYGETLARITTSFPHWFAGNYRGFADRVDALPVDQHMLLALMAPRALYVASADEDLWADPRGEFLSLAHASPVYALWGDPAIGAGDMPALEQPLVRGRRGYHVRRGTHNLTPYDWERFVDFAATVWTPAR
jgi:hypothetical protein